MRNTIFHRTNALFLKLWCSHQFQRQQAETGGLCTHTQEINKILPLSLVFIFRPEESTDVMLTSHERISTQRVVRLFSHRASILKQKHSLSDSTAVCHFSATWTGTGRWRSTAHELYIDPLLRLDEEKIAGGHGDELKMVLLCGWIILFEKDIILAWKGTTYSNIMKTILP